MRLAGIFVVIGWGGGFLALLMTIPMFFAMLTGQGESAYQFFLSMLITLFISGALIFIGRGTVQLRAYKVNLFLAATACYVLLPFLIALPFIGTGQNVSFWPAYFEAVSALTTTGASIYANPEYESGAILLWRALVGWFGGLLILSYITAILAPQHLSFLSAINKIIKIRQEDKSLLRRMQQTTLYVLRPYALLTLISIHLLWLSGVPGFQAFCLSLSAISTTGFLTQQGSLDTYISSLSLFCLCLIMLLGAMGFPSLIRLTKLQIKRMVADEQFHHFIYFVLLFALFLMLAHYKGDVFHALSVSVSLVTTTMFPVFMPGNPTQGLSPLLFFLPMIIGGMSLSTGGGMKIIRGVVLFRRLMQELHDLFFPNAVKYLEYNKRRVSIYQLTSTWSILVIMIVSFAVILLVGSLFYDEFTPLWVAGFGLVSNSGGIVNMTGYPDLFTQLPAMGYIFFSLVMIAGRLGLLVVLILSQTYWHADVL